MNGKQNRKQLFTVNRVIALGMGVVALAVVWMFTALTFEVHDSFMANQSRWDPMSSTECWWWAIGFVIAALACGIIAPTSLYLSFRARSKERVEYTRAEDEHQRKLEKMFDPTEPRIKAKYMLTWLLKSAWQCLLRELDRNRPFSREPVKPRWWHYKLPTPTTRTEPAVTAKALIADTNPGGWTRSEFKVLQAATKVADPNLRDLDPETDLAELALAHASA